nr:T9SS type A sorting domain-containing protein [Bacteroidota bacterium]
GKDLINCLLTKGFDIYVINYKYNSQDIRNNAAIFSAGIRFVSALNSNQPIVAAGMSMGGVINRYACAKAENDGVPLPISKFITFDAPHQGAVISSVLQDWRKTKTVGDVYAQHASNNDAAKQLLNYNAFDMPGTINSTFFNELNSLNGDGYPHLVPTIGVSFSTTSPNPNSGEWLYVNVNGVPGNYDQHFYLTPNELVAGSFLPAINVDPMPVSDSKFWSSSLLSFLRAFSDPTVSLSQYKNPSFISHTSSLDMIGGISKFDITLQPSATGFHDVIPSDLIEPIVNALINSELYLQDKTVTDTRNYIAGDLIAAGDNVTSALPIGNFTLTGTSVVTMKAGVQITLEPGFVVLTGSSFTAQISEVECDGVPSTQFRTSVLTDEVLASETLESIPASDEKRWLTEDIKQNNLFLVYPNPTNSFVVVETKIPCKEISLFNSFGVVVFVSEEIDPLLNKIDLSSFPKGVYLLRVTDSEGGTKTSKIIKQ